ncbi:superoxide dismutase, Fe-Mn family [Sporothrix schenckii 1099-18]|uniref:Superoxide dismutase n=1 Tax=Sporothrix schenckii 1099-18 TaxID=1397361 RepID=A0A0F2MDC0_SPOSC|nr:superoxide dismutase, Fe-Mn family [Sporothrix schenckii 1099-18]KJR87642.1 superoxide dismutase, Fe-Mn family [Sporothrix schenckii 1099-18]
MSAKIYSLPALPYAYNALEPNISAQIMELHHKRHHQAYVDNLNKALQSLTVAIATGDAATQVSLQEAIRFNGGGHINHSLFWRNLAPAGRPESDPSGAAAPTLVQDINQTWGSVDNFKKFFSAALLGIKSSGWGWLVLEPATGLHIVTTKDQDSPVGGEIPILSVDMWEHAYYLQYLNGKAAYVENIWKVINWQTAEERYLRGPPDAAKIIAEAV